MWERVSAIDASLLARRIASALLFTVGFVVNNVTEGFTIVGLFSTRSPVEVVNRRLVSLVAGLSLLAGLPVVPGALVYYLGISSELFTATLLTIATASIIYAMLHVNLSALAKLGGVSGPLF
jgi:ZIP family zinc transporter